jgi:hypothetical protein
MECIQVVNSATPQTCQKVKSGHVVRQTESVNALNKDLEVAIKFGDLKTWQAMATSTASFPELISTKDFAIGLELNGARFLHVNTSNQHGMRVMHDPLSNKPRIPTC